MYNDLEYRVARLEEFAINEGLFDKLFDKISFSLDDIFKKLPEALSFLGKKFKMNWKLNKDGKPIITSNLMIPISNKSGNYIQLITVLSLGLQKKLFSLNQRIIKAINNKQISKEEFPLWENESFKSLKDIITKVKDSLLNSTVNKVKDMFKDSGIKESMLYTYEDSDTGVIRKVGNKWKILKKNRRGYWDAEYDTKKDAQDALKAYWANKHECRRYNGALVVEGFLSDVGKNFIKNIQNFLIKIFGPSLYFDHYTDKSIDLYYKGKPVAELLYDDKNEEITIMPDDINIAPVSFYDTSEFEIKDYLSDLILGDLSPEFA